MVSDHAAVTGGGRAVERNHGNAPYLVAVTPPLYATVGRRRVEMIGLNNNALSSNQSGWLIMARVQTAHRPPTGREDKN